MSRVNKSQYALLGMLTLGPMSGYDMKKLFDGSLANFWTESYGQIYPILKRLVSQGWATLKEEPQAGKPDKKVYAITAKGRTALQKWLEEPTEAPGFRLEVLLKLFFGPEVPMDVNRRQVQAFRQLALERLESYRGIEAGLKADKSGHAGTPYWLITLDYGRTYHEGVVQWCDRTLKRLK
ncbi:MAG TPA: PadR family transcriptional regulator [bacterium]